MTRTCRMSFGNRRTGKRAEILRAAVRLVAIAVLAAGPSKAGEVRAAPGVIDKDTVWEGTVRIDAPLRVAKNARLTVMPGTAVLFGKGAGLTVEGMLAAEGTPNARIRFGSGDEKPGPGAWSGI